MESMSYVELHESGAGGSPLPGFGTPETRIQKTSI